MERRLRRRLLLGRTSPRRIASHEIIRGQEEKRQANHSLTKLIRGRTIDTILPIVALGSGIAVAACMPDAVNIFTSNAPEGKTLPISILTIGGLSIAAGLYRDYQISRSSGNLNRMW